MTLALASIAILFCGNVVYAADASAGGKWVRHDKIDKMTDAKTVYFSLSSEESEYPMIAIVCKATPDGKRKNHAIYAAHEALAGPEVTAQVRVDKKSAYAAAWRLFSSSGATMDAKTAHALLTGMSLLVRVQAASERMIESSFSLTGLHVSDVKDACGSDVFSQNAEP